MLKSRFFFKQKMYEIKDYSKDIYYLKDHALVQTEIPIFHLIFFFYHNTDKCLIC